MKNLFEYIYLIFTEIVVNLLDDFILILCISVTIFFFRKYFKNKKLIDFLGDNQEDYISAKSYFFKNIIIVILLILIQFIFDEKSLLQNILKSFVFGSFLLVRFGRMRDVLGIDKKYHIEAQKKIKIEGYKNFKPDKKIIRMYWIFWPITLLDVILIQLIIFSDWDIKKIFVFFVPGIILQLFLLFKSNKKLS